MFVQHILSILILISTCNQNVFSIGFAPTPISKMFSKVNSKGFGPFFAQLNFLKFVDSTKKNKSSVSATYLKLVDNVLVVGNITLFQDVKCSGAYLKVELWRNEKYETIYERYSHTPCRDPTFNMLLKLTFKGIDDRCIFKKGTIHVKQNLNELAHMYSEIWFYDKILVTSDWLSKKESLLCYRYEVVTRPLKKSEKS